MIPEQCKNCHIVKKYLDIKQQGKSGKNAELDTIRRAILKCPIMYEQLNDEQIQFAPCSQKGVVDSMGAFCYEAPSRVDPELTSGKVQYGRGVYKGILQI